MLGCLLVLMFSAGAGAVFVLEQVHTVVQDLSATKALKVDKRALAVSSFGQPETLLMVGDDTRSVYKYYNAFVPNLANEMLLVRIDPSQPYISMLSLPRELWVNITEPNGERYTNRLNSAYTFGTTTLLNTIRQVTGLSVNHVIATTFTQFENAINTLGCVYDTIDERYYHNNADGGAQYQNVNLQPGYQCLNGSDAEQFVSYRHTDTSQVRDARDQSFLLAVKAQYGPELAGNISKFEKVFGRTVQTDQGLRSTSEILNLANLLITAAGLRVRQVPFQTDPCSNTCPSGDLTATPQQITSSVKSFLYGAAAVPRVAKISHKLKLKNLPLTATLAANVVGEQATATKLQFTAEFPRVQDLAGSAIPVSPQCTETAQACIRNYLIHAPDGNAYPIYVEAFSNGDLGQFYDVQGTTWTSAPLFEHPSQTTRVGTRTFELFYNGSHLETVAWHEYGAVYWVHNTLTDAVSNGELLGIAEQTEPVGTVRHTPTHVTLKAFSIPSKAPPTVRTSGLESVARTGRWIAFVMAVLLLLAVARARWRVRQLRGLVYDVAARTVMLETQVVAAEARSAGMGVRGPAERLVHEPFTPRPRAHGLPPLKRHIPRRWALIGLGLVVLVAAGGAFLAVDSTTARHKHTPRAQLPSSLPVAVLNAGTVNHAARNLALVLTKRHVHVVATGNLAGSQPTSYEVLYTAGDAHQARVLAAILKPEHPVVAQAGATTAPVVHEQSFSS